MTLLHHVPGAPWLCSDCLRKYGEQMPVVCVRCEAPTR
jgi:hypothetical protein